MRIHGSESDFACCRGYDAALLQPRQKRAIVNAARVTEMSWPLASHLFYPRAIVIDLADEEVAILWHAMTMRVQLNIDSTRGHLGDFRRSNVLDDALSKHRVVIHAQHRSELSQQVVLLLRRKPFGLCVLKNGHTSGVLRFTRTKRQLQIATNQPV